MKSTPYTIHYGIGMLMNFEPLAYDTLKFEASSSVVSLSNSEVGDKNTLQSILEKNEKLSSIVSKHLFDFPLFNLVHTQPTDEFYFTVKNTNTLTTHTLLLDIQNSSRTHVVIAIEDGAKVILAESITGSAYLGYTLDIIVGKGAEVTFVAHPEHTSMRTVLRNAYLQENSLIKWMEGTIEGELIQSHIRTYLYEPGSRAEVKGIFALAGSTVVDMYHSMYHLASHTTSDMLTKGVLNGKAKALYQGLIHIDEKSVGCTGYQKEDSLVLSNSAEVNAVPNLEIENSDVKCSHGVTTAHIDREKLFYAQSRGISEKNAAQLFVDGHVSPCLDAISDENAHITLQERMHRNLAV